MSNATEKLANIAIVATCLVLGYRYLMPVPSRDLRPNLPAVGEVMPAVRGIDYSAHDRTLILGLRSTCGFCTESMSLYKELVAGATTNDVQIIAVSSESVAVLTKYLARHGLVVSSSLSMPYSNLNIASTPTIFVVSRDGRVIGAWRGLLDSEREAEVRRAIGP